MLRDHDTRVAIERWLGSRDREVTELLAIYRRAKDNPHKLISQAKAYLRSQHPKNKDGTNHKLIQRIDDFAKQNKSLAFQDILRITASWHGTENDAIKMFQALDENGIRKVSAGRIYPGRHSVCRVLFVQDQRE